MREREVVRTGNAGRGRRLSPGMTCTYTTSVGVAPTPVLVLAMDDDPTDTWVTVLRAGETLLSHVAPAWLHPLRSKMRL